MPKLSKALPTSTGIAILSLALLASSKPGALAEPGFTNADLKGDYAAAGLLVNVASGGVISRFTADGAGNITAGFQAACFGGPPADCSHHTSFTCTYAVAPNGTGSVTCEHLGIDGPGFTSTHEFVLADGGKEIFLLLDEPGSVILGKRQ